VHKFRDGGLGGENEVSKWVISGGNNLPDGLYGKVKKSCETYGKVRKNEGKIRKSGGFE
jgi:hypothetical protein